MPTRTITFDAVPIATPKDLPTLAQGSYGLPLNLNSAPNTCFNNTAQSAAWSCNIAFNEAVALQVQITRNAPQLGKDGAYDVVLAPNYTNIGSSGNDAHSSNGVMYGSSAPKISPAMNMELVNDTFDLARGPAWFRMLPYNKTVVVSEALFSASSSRKSRREPGFNGVPTTGKFQRKGMADAGDRPWICIWPGTFVEIFIYATQNSSYAAQSTATITTEPSTAPTATKTGTGSVAAATNAGTEVINMGQEMTAYPKAIKVKERRVNSAPRAYCYQVEVQSDNITTAPVTDASGNVVVVNIDEIDQPNGLDKRGGGDDDDANMSDCGCMWFSS